VGLVAIGRNEGARLERCLQSSLHRVDCGVYVDSGSTDGSIALARRLGASVVELDTSVPFTAARARNAGLARLLELDPGLSFVQFVDGDCEVAAHWLERAAATLAADAQLAVVCGRRRERFPDASIYNQLCDMEWNAPPGPARECGGDAMMRVEALRQIGGYRPEMIAGEEPELCFRLRAAGWKVLRLADEMTLHDADMHRLSQWWRRARRAGHAYAEGAALHGRSPERHKLAAVRSMLLWAAAVPAAGLALCAWAGPLGLLLPAGLYGALVARIYGHARVRGFGAAPALRYAAFTALAKFPQLAGLLEYASSRLRGRRSTLIEYKGPQAAP
jgi:GT2 family glycosyltransferase